MGGAAMSPEHCRAQLSRLSVLRGLPDDIAEYIAVLVEIPELIFTEAVSHALKTRTWFPTPAELRADADVAAAAFRSAASVPEVQPRFEEVGDGRVLQIPNPFGGAPLTIPITRVWRFDCRECTDTGWRSHQCPDVHCGRRFEHAPHEWVDPCPCRETNPTLRRHREAQAKYSKEPAHV